MGLQEVKAEIAAEADLQAEQIIRLAQEQAEVVRTKAKDEIRDYQKEAKLHIQSLFRGLEQKLLAAARFEAQRLLLNTKKKLVEDVMNEVKTTLTSLNKTERARFLQDLLSRAKSEIEVDTLLMNKADDSLIKNKVRIKESNISGGLIAQNKSGTIQVNLSIEELLEQVRVQTFVALSQTLFDDG